MMKYKATGKKKKNKERIQQYKNVKRDTHEHTVRTSLERECELAVGDM